MTQPPGPPAGPAPGAPPGPPPGRIDLTLQGSWATSSLIGPKVRINGWPVSTSYGLNPFVLAPGRWHVEVSMQWMRAYGQAAMSVDLAPGQVVPVFYVAPLHQFTTGSIGHEKQRRRGRAIFVAIMLLIVVVVLAANGVLSF